MKKFTIIFLSMPAVIFCSALFVCAKADNSLYVEDFPQNAMINIFAERDFMTVVSIDFDGFAPKTMESKSNANDKIGIGAGYKSISFSYAFDITKRSKGIEAKSYDFQFYFFQKQWIIDAFYQYYRGHSKAYGMENFMQRWKGVELTRGGLSVQYVFNPNLSLEAAFKQTKLQKKSAGSFLLGASIYYNGFNLNFPEDIYDYGWASEDGHNWLIGPTIGYAYTAVFLKNFYFTGSMSMGISFPFDNTTKSSLFWNFIPKFALGYNADTWALILCFIYNYGIVDVDNYSENELNPSNVNNTGRLTLSFTKRFDFF
ncbi:MAG: DUF4421 domain-containing protein [Elusimicrobiota bacterium]|jgi:hypothetical protein|nr:DUF4421 domain-containing protein [Elusimicrobiota bacterium]